MKVTIDFIPHGEQRYDTCGDWVWDSDSNLKIFVSDTSNWRHDMAVAVHELVEAVLCRHEGIHYLLVDHFDMHFSGDGEPGDDPLAPYRDQHCFATAVERMLIAAMGLSWKDYDDALPHSDSHGSIA